MTSLVEQIGNPHHAPFVISRQDERNIIGDTVYSPEWSIFDVVHPEHKNLRVSLHQKNATRYYKNSLLHDPDADTPAVFISELQISYQQLADNKASVLPPARQIFNYKGFYHSGKNYYESWDNMIVYDFQFPNRRSSHTTLEVREAINNWKVKLTPYDLDPLSIEYIVNPLAQMMFIQDILKPLMVEGE